MFEKFIDAATQIYFFVDIVSGSHRRRLRYHNSELSILWVLVFALLPRFTICFLLDDFALYFVVFVILSDRLYLFDLSC